MFVRVPVIYAVIDVGVCVAGLYRSAQHAAKPTVHDV